MKAPDFWWRKTGGLEAALLAPLAALYGRYAGWRMARHGAEADIPVICIGNLVAGGAGKTPLALLVARKLQDRGLRPAFLSRGYGGRLKGPVVVDGERHDARDVGDEPLLLDRVATAIVSHDRVTGADLAHALGADAVVMDDGLQNPSLAKTLSLAVVDAQAGIGNGFCLPAGPLRAPLAVQLARIDALVLIGDGAPGEAVAAAAIADGKPVLRARLAPDAAVAQHLAGKRVLAFAGIGRPEKFFATLRDLGADLVQSRAFADHAPLSAAEVEGLLAQARSENLTLVTTAKDQARFSGQPQYAALAAETMILPVTLVMREGEALLDEMLARAVSQPG